MILVTDEFITIDTITEDLDETPSVDETETGIESETTPTETEPEQETETETDDETHTLTPVRVQSILLKLPGFVTDTTELTDLDYDKQVTNEEIEDVFDSAINYARSFCRQETLPFDNVIVNTAIDFWAAGLLWKKYDIRETDQEDETYTTGSGDHLIIQAKQMLKPFKFYEFEAW